MNTIKVFFTFLIIFSISNSLMSPAEAASGHRSSPKSRLIEKTSFKIAGDYFRNSQYDRAIVQYQDHIKNFPGRNSTDDAIFQLGEIYRLKKNYLMAIRYYQLLNKSAIESNLRHESEYKTALCYFHSGHYKNALQSFEAGYSSTKDKRREWEILFMMGRTFEKMDDNLSAFKKYLLSLQMAPGAALKQKSENILFKMVRKKLSLKDLTFLAGTFPKKFPLGHILFQLAEAHEEMRNYPLFKKYLTSFLNEFPRHELYEKGRKKLESYLAKSGPPKTRIACILPLSGEAALSGQKMLQGVQLAFNLIPDKERKNLELLVRDSKGDPETTAEIVKELGEDKNVVCIIGPMFSKTAKAAIEKAAAFQLPMISPSASAKGLPDSSEYFFRNSLTYELQGKGIAEYAVNHLDLNKFITFYPSNLYGSRLKDNFLDQVSFLGGEVLAGKSYEPGQNDFRDQILAVGGLNDRNLKKKALESISKEDQNIYFKDKKLIEYQNVNIDKNEALSTVLVEIIKQQSKEESKPVEIQEEDFDNRREVNKIITEDDIMGLQVGENQELLLESEPVDLLKEELFFRPFLKVHYDAVFLPGRPEQVGLIAPQLAFYNINNVQLLGGNAWNSKDIIERGGKFVRGAIFVDGFFSGSYLKRVRKFNALYEDFFGEEPDILSAQAFDAASMVFDITSKTPVNRVIVKKELQKINNFRGVSGKTTILPNGDSEKSLFFMSIKKKRRIQIN